MKDIIMRRINEENKTARRYILDRVTMALSPQVEVSPCAARRLQLSLVSPSSLAFSHHHRSLYKHTHAHTLICPSVRLFQSSVEL